MIDSIWRIDWLSERVTYWLTDCLNEYSAGCSAGLKYVCADVLVQCLMIKWLNAWCVALLIDRLSLDRRGCCSGGRVWSANVIQCALCRLLWVVARSICWLRNCCSRMAVDGWLICWSARSFDCGPDGWPTFLSDDCIRVDDILISKGLSIDYLIGPRFWWCVCVSVCVLWMFWWLYGLTDSCIACLFAAVFICAFGKCICWCVSRLVVWSIPWTCLSIDQLIFDEILICWSIKCLSYLILGWFVNRCVRKRRDWPD